LPTTTDGHEYILVVKCALTQWIELIPLRTKTAVEVAEALVEHVYCRHGSIERVVSDKGTEFINKVHKAVHHLLAQHHSSTTPYNPQANGKVENVNRTVKDMLSGYAHENQRDWDRFLQVVAHAYRTTVNAATGYSPFRALYGREARQPTEEWIEDFARQNNLVSMDEYVQRLTVALHYSWTNMADRVREKT
jgi:transposase InsO family protein